MTDQRKPLHRQRGFYLGATAGVGALVILIVVVAVVRHAERFAGCPVLPGHPFGKPLTGIEYSYVLSRDYGVGDWSVQKCWPGSHP